MKSKKIRWLLSFMLVIGLVTLSVAAQAAIQPGTNNKSNQGKVSDGHGPGAAVQAVKKDAPGTIAINIPVSGATWYSGSSQTISWSGMGPSGNSLGPVDVTLWKGGQLAATIAGAVSANVTYQVPLALVSSAYELRITSKTYSGLEARRPVNVMAAGKAVITVTDGASPVSGATVSVTVNGAVRTATSDSAGKASFSDLPPGNYAFTATKPGYNNGTTSVTVAMGEATGVISMARQYGHAIITVLGPGNTGSVPLSGVAVSVTVDGAVRTLITDASGKARFAHIPAGRSYAFSATKAGYATHSSSTNVWIYNETIMNITILCIK